MMMQQFTAAEIPFSPPLSSPNHHHHHQTTTMNNPLFHRIRPWPGFPTTTTSKPGFSNNNNNNSLGDATCMEQLLTHCALAIENNDATPAQQILWVLNNIAPPDGDSNQRLTCAFLRALILRASRSPACKMMLPTTTTTTATLNSLITTPHRFTLLELAHFVDLTPWHRFGFTAANSIILDAIGVGDHQCIHIVDISATHCMQFPTLIDSIATRFATLQRPPPLLRLTVAALSDLHAPPVFDLLSYDDLGSKLVNFARSRNVPLEFKAVPTSPSDGFASLLEEVRQSAITDCTNINNNLNYINNAELQQHPPIIVNCQMTLHYLQEDDDDHDHHDLIMMSSTRTMFLQAVRALEPDVVVIVEEDADFSARNLVDRLRSAFSYLWIPFDTVDTFLPRGTKQREWYEADVCWKIENVVAHEGGSRVERQEVRGQWAHRMREAEFRGAEAGEEAVAEVKAMLEEHAAGWGAKKEEDDLVLTWKGHNVVFASAWVPAN